MPPCIKVGRAPSSLLSLFFIFIYSNFPIVVISGKPCLSRTAVGGRTSWSKIWYQSPEVWTTKANFQSDKLVCIQASELSVFLLSYRRHAGVISRCHKQVS